MSREIEIRSRAEKDLRVIPRRDGERIAKGILELRTGLSGDVKRLTNFTPEYRLRVGDWRVLFEIEGDKNHHLPYSLPARRLPSMTAQIIEKAGKKEFAVIPYKDYLRMQEALEDYHALKALRQAKADPKNRRGRPFLCGRRGAGVGGQANDEAVGATSSAAPPR